MEKEKQKKVETIYATTTEKVIRLFGLPIYKSTITCQEVRKEP